MRKMINNGKSVLVLLTLMILAIFTVNGCAGTAPAVRSFIRVNQVGFSPEDIKSAVIVSQNEINDLTFRLVPSGGGNSVFNGVLTPVSGTWGKFKYHYRADFSSFRKEGKYTIKAAGANSVSFLISTNAYSGILDSLLKFYKVQRCGPTAPLLHGVCHLHDSPLVSGDSTVKGIDVTGGWHDAGDYRKFFTTISLTTYLLLLAYEHNPQVFEFDRDFSGAPDILEEARVGIDWIIRANYAPGKLITQVQDIRDQEIGWRMPEKDSLQFDRPAFYGIGKNQVGMFAAVMALASKIWKERFNEFTLAEKWLTLAENMYSYRNSVPDIDKNPSGMYQDNSFLGKLALGAIEMYHATSAATYLTDAKTYATKADADYWWSWGNINGLVQYRVALADQTYKQYLLRNLSGFETTRSTSIYGTGAPYTWGTTNTLLGIALQGILWRDLTGGNEFDTLITWQRDYVLGKNPWGISFVYQFGSNYSKYFHSQVAHFNRGYLPGGIAAGPIPKELYDTYKIDRKNLRYNEFNTDSVYYFDDKDDYLSNEPTIVTNAAALFVFGHWRR